MQITKNPLPPEISAKIENTLNSKILSATSLGGGAFAKVMRITLLDGQNVVAKIAIGDSGKRLSIEGYMLEYLLKNTNLPTSKVYYYDDELLLVEYIVVNGNYSSYSQSSAAEYLAELHNISSDYYGFEQDTLIGGLNQPNPKKKSWLDFFINDRILYMAEQSHNKGNLPVSVMQKLNKFIPKIPAYVSEPKKPSLIHGDIWTGNVLYRDGKVVAFIDPALYFADSEMELTFSTVYDSFGNDFFNRYNEIRPLSPEFFETKRDIYNLYALLVHNYLFGHSYAFAIDATLSKFI